MEGGHGARSEGTLRYGEAGDAENSMGGCYFFFCSQAASDLEDSGSP